MELFHVLNRGVDKRKIVLDISDRLRFMQGLYMYNDKNIIERNTRRQPQYRRTPQKRNPLVAIHAFCLMDNHYHLLLSPIANDVANLSAFMRKLNMGYAKYFNEKYDRSGALWQGKYKRIHIKRDEHFQYIPYYIHLNPLDIKFPEWRKGALQSMKSASDFLRSYKWSSYLDYNETANYPSIIDKKLLAPILGDPVQQLKTIKNIVGDPVEALTSEIIE